MRNVRRHCRCPFSSLHHTSVTFHFSFFFSAGERTLFSPSARACARVCSVYSFFSSFSRWVSIQGKSARAFSISLSADLTLLLGRASVSVRVLSSLLRCSWESVTRALHSTHMRSSMHMWSNACACHRVPISVKMRTDQCAVYANKIF